MNELTIPVLFEGSLKEALNEKKKYRKTMKEEVNVFFNQDKFALISTETLLTLMIHSENKNFVLKHQKGVYYAPFLFFPINYSLLKGNEL